MMLDDVANPDEQIMVPAAPRGRAPGGPRAPKPPLLALLDRVEGDPEDEEEGEEEVGREEQDGQEDEKPDREDKVAIDDFHPFTFVRTGRKVTAGPRTGEIQMAWQVQCPFHKDKGDHPQTFCRRAVNFSDDAEERDAVSKFKLWCILGRACSSRAIKPHGHKFVDMRGREIPGDAQLRERLQEGLRATHWVIREVAELTEAAEGPDEQEGDSDSSSSSDAS